MTDVKLQVEILIVNQTRLADPHRMKYQSLTKRWRKVKPILDMFQHISVSYHISLAGTRVDNKEPCDHRRRCGSLSV